MIKCKVCGETNIKKLVPYKNSDKNNGTRSVCEKCYYQMKKK